MTPSRNTRIFSWALYDFANSADGVPTQGMREMYAEHRRQLDALTAEWNGIVSGDLAALNARAKDAGVAFVAVPAD